MAPKEASPDHNVELQKKRQSVIDSSQRSQLEAAQGEVHRNQDTLTSLRRENKELRTAYTQTMRGQRTINMDDHYQKEEELLHNKMCVLRRTLNSVKGKNVELQEEIEKTVQENQFVVQEGNAMLDEGSPMAQKIRTLENRLDKCLIKHNEVDAIRKTYEVLLERLQLEQGGFDLQLNALEKAISSDDKELHDLSAVGADASSGRDEAKANVARLKVQLTENRKEHRRDIEQRRMFVQEKREFLEMKHNLLLERMAKQEERHNRLLQGERGQKVKRKGHGSSPFFNQDELERLQQMKDSYQQLRDVTMGQNVGEVIHKLLERRENSRGLHQVLSELESAIETLTAEKTQLEKTWNETNQRAGGAMVAPALTRLTRDQKKSNAQDEDYTEEGSRNDYLDHRLLAERQRENRAIVEEFERHLRSRQEELEDAQREQEFLFRLLIDVEAGVQHLAHKLSVGGIEAPIMNNMISNNVSGVSGGNSEYPPVSITGMGGISLGDDTDDSAVAETSSSVTVGLLRSCEEKLQMMLEELSPDEIQGAVRSIMENAPIVPTANIRLPRLLPGGATYRSKSGGDSVEDDSADDRLTMGSVGATVKTHRQAPALVDDFPDNEVHDRHELKMMSLAAVEREVKKARQLQQRRKEEGRA